MYFSCNDLDERPFNSRIASNQLQIPTAMISLDMWMPPSSLVDKWGLIDVGQLGPAGRWDLHSVPELSDFLHHSKVWMVHSKQNWGRISTLDRPLEGLQRRIFSGSIFVHGWSIRFYKEECLQNWGNWQWKKVGWIELLLVVVSHSTVTLENLNHL